MLPYTTLFRSQRDPPPSLAALDPDRAQAQQDRPHQRTAGHPGGPWHDLESSPSRSHRRREVSKGARSRKAGNPFFGEGHAQETRSRAMKLSDIADNAGTR